MNKNKEFNYKLQFYSFIGILLCLIIALSSCHKKENDLLTKSPWFYSNGSSIIFSSDGYYTMVNNTPPCPYKIKRGNNLWVDWGNGFKKYYHIFKVNDFELWLQNENGDIFVYTH